MAQPDPEEDLDLAEVEIDVEFKDASLEEVLAVFAEKGEVNIVPDANVRGGRINLKLQRVAWDDALRTILRGHGLGLTGKGNLLRVAPLAQLASERRSTAIEKTKQAFDIVSSFEPLQTRVLRLEHGEAPHVAAKIVSAALSKRGKVVIDERTNTVIVTDVPSRLRAIVALAEQLDKPTDERRAKHPTPRTHPVPPVPPVMPPPPPPSP
jgi:type IV pilus assembly protein PilQ